jgi:hypothetical protein
MSGRTGVPPELRRRIAADLKPVRPLPPPWVRAMWVGAVGVATLLGAAAMSGVRADASQLGMALSWGAAVFELLTGLLLVALALREAVPGAALARQALACTLAAGVTVELAVAGITWMHSRSPVPGSALAHGVQCFTMEGAFGVPALVLTLFLALRAYPVRPRWAGAVGGLGAGLLADGAQHLVCPYSDLRHVIVWHGGAMLALGVVGWLVGWGAERWLRRRPRELPG